VKGGTTGDEDQSLNGFGRLGEMVTPPGDGWKPPLGSHRKLASAAAPAHRFDALMNSVLPRMKRRIQNLAQQENKP
jgi:hypothetical protein